MQQQVLEDRPEAQAGKKVSAPTMRHTPTSSRVKSGVLTGRCPATAAHLLSRHVAGDGQYRDDQEEAADQHGRSPIAMLYQHVAFRPANAEPLLPSPEVYE